MTRKQICIWEDTKQRIDEIAKRHKWSIVTTIEEMTRAFEEKERG